MSDHQRDAIERAWAGVVATAHRTAADGLVVGTSGNVSARVGDTILVTLVPEVPPIHYAAAVLGGPVRVAAYARYGTDELAVNMLDALRDRTGCLLQNHGTVTHGTTLDEAYDRTAQLEWLCRLRLAASSVPGRSPNLLSPAQLDDVREALKGYGQPR